MPSSLRRRVLVLLLLFVTQVTAATLFVFRLAAQHRAASESFRDAIVLSRLVHNLESRIHAAAMAGNDHLIAGAPPIQKERFAAADAEVARLFRTLAGRELADPVDRQTLVTVERRYADISTLAARLFTIDQPVGNLVAGELMERMDRAADEATTALGSLLARADRRIEVAGEKAAALAFRLRVAALTSLAAVVLLSGVSVALLNGWILRPLREMRESIARMQLGGHPTPADRSAAPARRPPRNELSEVSDRLRAKFLEIGRLAELTAAINEGLSLEEVLDLVYERFAGLIPYDRIGLALVEDDGRILRSRWSRTRAPKKMVPDGYAAALERSSLAQVLAGGRPRILNDLVDYLRRKPESQSTALVVAEGMRSSLTCPLVLRGTPVGVMFFSSMRPDAYRDAHVDLFLQISGQLAAIVEKSRLHDELVHLNRLKNDFLGMAAHDLRNPAAAIAGYAEILRHDAAETLPSRSQGMLERIRGLATEISTLLDGLLDVAVIESGTFVLAPRSVALAEFLEEVRARNQLLAESKGGALVVASAGTEIARFDPVRIHQVLGNLIGNAVKFSPAGSRVHVQATASEADLEFAVRDEGPGIPAEEQAGLFRDFRRASTRPTGGERSTGLGLAICRRIVEAHGGTIGVESRPGEGATFRFSLPGHAAA